MREMLNINLTHNTSSPVNLGLSKGQTLNKTQGNCQAIKAIITDKRTQKTATFPTHTKKDTFALFKQM